MIKKMWTSSRHQTGMDWDSTPVCHTHTYTQQQIWNLVRFWLKWIHDGFLMFPSVSHLRDDRRVGTRKKTKKENGSGRWGECTAGNPPLVVLEGKRLSATRPQTWLHPSWQDQNVSWNPSVPSLGQKKKRIFFLSRLSAGSAHHAWKPPV